MGFLEDGTAVSTGWSLALPSFFQGPSPLLNSGVWRFASSLLSVQYIWMYVS